MPCAAAELPPRVASPVLAADRPFALRVQDRKVMIKAMKGDFMEVCCNPQGHLVAIRALDVTDDTVRGRCQRLLGCLGTPLRSSPSVTWTACVCLACSCCAGQVLTGDLITKELVPELPSLVCHQFGRKVLLWLLSPGNKSYFSPTGTRAACR